MKKKLNQRLLSFDISKMIRIVIVITILIFVLSGIIGEKYLYADGSNYFYNTVREGVFHVYPAGRKMCDQLMQIFVVIAYKLGCKSFTLMAYAFGFGLTFWVSLFYIITIGIFLRHKRYSLACISFLLMFVSLFSTGFFLQIESILGLALYTAQIAIIVTHVSDKSISAVIETIILFLLLILSIHCNEYFCAWGVVLTLTVIVRVFFTENKLHPLWLVLVIPYIYIAYTSYSDISARGSAPSLFDTCMNILKHKGYMILIVLLVCILLTALDLVKIPKKEFIIDVLLITLFIFLMSWTYIKTDRIALESYNLRWGNLGWGVLFGVFVLIVEKFQLTFDQQYLIECIIILGIGLSLYNIKSGVEYHRYNNAYVEFTQSHAHEGFVTRSNSSFQESLYRWFWTVGQQSLCIQGIRGEKEISCMVLGDGDYFKDLDITMVGDLSRYGITIDVKDFEDSVHLISEEDMQEIMGR